MISKYLVLALLPLALVVCQEDDVEVTVTSTSSGLLISLVQGAQKIEKLNGVLGVGQNFEGLDCNDQCEIEVNGSRVYFNLTRINNGVEIEWITYDTKLKLIDCIDLHSEDTHWFGGPERWSQQWPIEKIKMSDDSYVIKGDNSQGIAEPYWLNSKGGYIYVDRKTPLFIDQNNRKKDSVCLVAQSVTPYIRRTRTILKYSLIATECPKCGHNHAIQNYLGKPKAHPNEKMIREPIWTTWAKYKKDINDNTVRAFAQDIKDHGFKGQIEIDDDWEICYGAQEFKKDKFVDIKETVKELKQLGFRVTLWIHPFVNDACQNNSQTGKDLDLFVKDENGSDHASWWDGSNAHQIDFTKEEAQNWFLGRLKILQAEIGIDSFKFDAGETHYTDQPGIFQTIDSELWPNCLTENYIRTCAKMGDLIEVRSGHRTQDLPIFVRMLDKDSTWGDNNGLYTLITTLLQMNMNGYSWVLPDMIGGNGYGEKPTAELIARWIQANTFMPTMQFSYLPWEITDPNFDGVAIIKKFVDLHEQYADEILKVMNNSILTGAPTNPPVWWVDPKNPDAHKVDDEYLLGTSILVAPVIVQGAIARDVFLPSGSWKDGNNGTVYKGPTTLKSYSAPIDVLPYFIRQTEP